MATKASRRRFGQVAKMRSGRWQARFTVPLEHPSGRGGQIVTAPHTFEANTYGREAAGDWLRAGGEVPPLGHALGSPTCPSYWELVIATSTRS